MEILQDSTAASVQLQDVAQIVCDLLDRSPRPSITELVSEVDGKLGGDACRFLPSILNGLIFWPSLSAEEREYIKSILADGNFNSSLLFVQVKSFIGEMLNQPCQPSANELVIKIEETIGIQARWHILSAINYLSSNKNLTRSQKCYLLSIVNDGSLENALSGIEIDNIQNVSTGIDLLLSQSKQYRNTSKFKEMVEFVGRFRDYAPYNNMLVHVQNPSCSFYATASDWQKRFGRNIKEDARPLLILAPMHPVMLVYDLDQTEGKDLPAELLNFANFQGEWNPKWIDTLTENARRHLIRIEVKKLSSTNAGFANLSRQRDGMKMRIALHHELDEPSKFGVLCHELAHIFLGHLGSDKDLWWPTRTNLPHKSIEIEAESVAFIVTNHLGMKGSSPAYVSKYLGPDDKIPESVSIDYIAKVAGKIERMALGLLPEPKVKPEKKIKGRATQ